MSRNSLILGVVAFVAAAAGGWYLVTTPADAPVSLTEAATPAATTAPAATDQATPPATEPALLPDRVLGAADAPVTIIEYASFTCPHCAAFHQTVMKPLKADYIDTGKVKFILREVYFDKFGLWAGMIAGCAGDAKYYPVAGLIFDQQKNWIGDGSEAAITANLRKVAIQSGLTEQALDACLNDQARAEQMVNTYQTHATADQIKGTPTLIINGEKHKNMSYEDLKKIIDAKIAG